ncbi:MAG: hypothetical protein ACLUFV_02935 [Acutalibacteraceae bacterium]
MESVRISTILPVSVRSTPLAAVLLFATISTPMFESVLVPHSVSQ